MYGTHYIFQVSIAILRLIQHDLLQLDLSGINDYLKSFKDDEKLAYQVGAAFSSKSMLPPYERIIEESLKVKLNEVFLDQLRADFIQIHAPKKEEKKNKARKLEKVKQ